MKKLFDNFLKNGLSEYDKKYVLEFKYIMLLSKNNIINAYFTNDHYIYFLEYPIFDKEYDTPLEVLESEISLTDCDTGIIYENFNGTFKTIAFINKKDNSNKKSY